MDGAAKEQPACLSQQQKKSACALAWNVQHLAEKFGLDRLAFFTLTFAENLTDRKEAQRRWNSLATNVLRKRYCAGIRVVERQARGAVHYHCVIVLDADIRSGYSWERDAASGRKKYDPQAPQALRDEWSFWRSTAPLYGFGRTEMKPIASTEQGIARYVGKYLGKHHKAKRSTDRGWRLAEYWGGARMAATRFGWCTENGAHWRAKVRLFAQIMSQRNGVTINSIRDLSKTLGPRWAHWHRDFIGSLPVVTVPPGYGLMPCGGVYSLATGQVLTTGLPARSSDK